MFCFGLNPVCSGGSIAKSSIHLRKWIRKIFSKSLENQGNKEIGLVLSIDVFCRIYP